MTGDRKWKAVEMPSGFWELHDEDGYALLEDLTESEARNIAAIDQIKAERDKAVELFEILIGAAKDAIFRKNDRTFLGFAEFTESKCSAFLTSRKEQGDE